MTVKFVLREDKTDKNGLAPVFIIAHFEGLRLQGFTREKCLPKEWNADKQRFRKAKEGYEEANNVLDAIAERVQKRYRELRTAGTPPALALIREVINPTAVVPELGFVEAMTAFIEVLRGRGYAFNTLRHYGTARNHLATFLASGRRKKINVANYDGATHDDFVKYLRTSCGLGANGIYSVVKDLKTFLRYAQDERQQTLGLELKQVEVRYADQAKTYLSGADLAALAAVKLSATLEPARDVFLFCCYTGLRYSDVAALHGGNLHALGANGDGDRVLRLVQTKTRATVSIYLSRLAADILDRYAAPERSGDGAKLLPVLANQPMNRYLKKITQQAGLKRLVEVVSTAGGRVVKEAVPLHELVTMHTARHTFAVQSLLRGMPVAVLQRVMGHSKIQNTMKYAQVVEELQHQAMRAAWDGPATPAAAVLDNAVCAVMAAA